MLIEKELEQKIIEALKDEPAFTGYLFTASRTQHEESDNYDGVIAVATGFRVNDAFSLSPISITVSMTIATRVENDATSEQHERAVERLADILSHWHKYTDTVKQLDCEKFRVGELRLDGGSGRKYDTAKSIWQETITFALRGSEIFNK